MKGNQMYKVLSVLALGLLAAACVAHDPDEEAVLQTETSWEPLQSGQNAVYVRSEPQAVQVQPVVIQQAPQKDTWWQQNRQKHVVKVVAPACPCKDPNDPCTHCYQK